MPSYTAYARQAEDTSLAWVAAPYVVQPKNTTNHLVLALVPAALLIPLVFYFVKQYRQPRSRYTVAHAVAAATRRIFLCYAPDDRPAVRDLYQRLQRDSFKPWMDSEDMLAGQDWRLTITNAIRESDVIIVCLSHHVLSTTGHFNKEMKLALDIADEQPDNTIFLIPVKLEACDVPERLSHLHPVNRFETDGYDRLLRALRER